MPPGRNNSDGWDECGMFVLKELERHGKQLSGLSNNGTQVLGELTTVTVELQALSGKIDQVCLVARRAMDLAVSNKNELSALTVKAGFWGLAGAAIPAIGIVLWNLANR